jgi:DNA sulfur modification protein DndB
MEAYNYQFTALRGIQAGREYYIAMCPLKLIPKIFLFDEEEIPAELRAQRVLNKARIPDIARYIINNSSEYVFSSITASVDGEVNFIALEDHGYGRNAGILTVSMNSRFLINDGQHRRAAIEEALRVRPEIGDETISVVFFLDAGLNRSQQIFADLNKHAIRPTKSIGILYDQRDPFALLSVKLIGDVPIFKGLTETEKTNISNRSTKLFTLSAVYQATQALLGKGKNDDILDGDFELACEFWTTLGTIIPEWQLIIRKQVAASALRQDYIHSHGVALHALGIVGRTLIETYSKGWEKRLQPLSEVNWLRTNPLWEGRAMVRGRMSKSTDNVVLTANAIKRLLGLPLDANEVQIENSHLAVKK